MSVPSLSVSYTGLNRDSYTLTSGARKRRLYLREVLDSSPDCTGDAPAEYTFLLGTARALSVITHNYLLQIFIFYFKKIM